MERAAHARLKGGSSRACQGPAMGGPRIPRGRPRKHKTEMPARTGEQFLRGLKDGRQVWIGGDRLGDVASHPAFKGAARALAGVYDLQHEHAPDCLMPDPETREPINVSHMIPRSKADLLRRHAGLERTAEYTVGIMGRTPDYMNVTYAGFAA